MKLSSFLSIRKKMQLIYLFSSKNNNEFIQYKDKKKVYVLLAADYGNLGDVAITFAQTKFLREQYPSYEVLELPISNTLSKLKKIKSVTTPDDIITIVGGGNLGDLYDQIEFLRQLVINEFPNNEIISFPQTIDFSQTVRGEKAKKTAVKVYSKHNNLTLMAREEISYENMKVLFPNNKIVLVPDIVMSLNCNDPIKEREGITLCLREDLEQLLTQYQKDELITHINSIYDNVSFYDTHIGEGRFSINDREAALDKIWTQFRSSEWVITDRLHGMIFCFITGTPAIILQNNNHKIKKCFEWIKSCGYIYLIESYSLEEVSKAMQNHVVINKHDEVLRDIKSRFNKVFKK